MTIDYDKTLPIAIEILKNVVVSSNITNEDIINIIYENNDLTIQEKICVGFLFGLMKKK
jgi:hypothetical protein